MNVLPIVFSILILLTIVTYSRLSGFVISKALQIEYEHFTRENQEEKLLAVAVKKYQKKHRSQGTQQDRSPPVQATRRLNLYPLLDANIYASWPAKVEMARFLLKSLIESLFRGDLFYQEAIENNPTIVDEFIGGLNRSALAYQKEKNQIISLKELGNLDLGDPGLQVFFYHILKDHAKESEEGQISTDEEQLIINKGLFDPSPLRDLIEVKKDLMPLRIFLADPKILLALFQKQEVVDRILEARLTYYKSFSKDKDLRDSLAADFERQFASNLPSWIDASFLNWQVSGTKPGNDTKIDSKKPLTSRTPK